MLSSFKFNCNSSRTEEHLILCFNELNKLRILKNIFFRNILKNKILANFKQITRYLKLLYFVISRLR